ncbi:hypothetical protein GGS20DRAFT_153713 [Poronia punctata]|nr:hypothetical protein GGS20DRAFT_153713 [Poronia punctata]
MPPRPTIFDSSTRNFVCKSCLSALRQRSSTPQWSVRQASRISNAPIPIRTKKRTSEQDSERIKALDTLGLTSEKQDALSVNYFQQERRGRLRRLRDSKEFGEVLHDPDGELDLRLRRIEHKLEPFEDINKVMTEKYKRGKADRLGLQYPEDSELPAEETDQQSISLLAIPINGLNGNRQDRIHRLNNWIRRCSKNLEKDELLPKDIQGLWKAYSAARTTLSERWNTVPAPTWQVLWQVLSLDYPFNANRMSHIYTISKDMQQAGVTLRPEQQILAIESMFVDGWENEAVENHRRHVSTLGTDPETFVSFWALGLQMYCRAGDFERAERVAKTISESPHQADPRFILPLIKLCAETPTAVEKGFGLYRNLREALGESMTIEDYDLIISYFLASESTEYALFIFVDMMKSGSVDLVGVRQYPPSIANPFFFGKWLKRLIGAGDLSGAFTVLRFMRSQGITPRAIQVNGLIGAWLRSGIADHVQQAEDVAWAMINTRIQFVELRRRRSDLLGVNLIPSGDAWPRANLETFSLLAENYRERGLTAKIGPLWQSFQEAEIAPDSFMLNQLLLSRIQEGQHEAVIATYDGMTKQFNLKPDSYTFMALWQSLSANRMNKVLSRDLKQETLKSRALFGEMYRHIDVFKTEDGIEIDHFLVRNILHSFRKIQDDVGLLLAYRALRRLFRYNPPDMVIFELLIGTLDLTRLAKRREGSKLLRARTSLDHYIQYRRKELAEAGKIENEDSLTREVRAEVAGDFLELQLETAFSNLTEDEVTRLVLETAEEMGMQHGTPEDTEGHASI